MEANEKNGLKEFFKACSLLNKPRDFSIDKVYSISILDFNIPKSSFGTGEVRHEAMLVNRDSGRLMSDKLVLIYLEMRYFNKTEGELATRMDKWLYLLRNLGQLPVK
jgi:hypothetical protein